MTDTTTPENGAQERDPADVPENEAVSEAPETESVEEEELSLDIELGESKELSLSDMFTGGMLVEQSPKKKFKLNDGRSSRLKIYMRSEVRNAMHAHAKEGGRKEIFGLILGHMEGSAQDPKLVISAHVRSDDTLSERTSVTLPSEAWTPLHQAREKEYPDEFILGWYHSHPDFGIFLSEYDLCVQRTAFNARHHLAYVVDPIRGEDGLFMWRGEEMVPAVGYYVLGEEGEEPPAIAGAPAPQQSISNFPLLLTVVLMFVLLACLSISQIRGLSGVKSDVSGLKTAAVQTEAMDNRLKRIEERVEGAVSQQYQTRVELNQLEQKLFPPALEMEPQAHMEQMEELIASLQEVLLRTDFGNDLNASAFKDRLAAAVAALADLNQLVLVYEDETEEID